MLVKELQIVYPENIHNVFSRFNVADFGQKIAPLLLLQETSHLIQTTTIIITIPTAPKVCMSSFLF